MRSPSFRHVKNREQLMREANLVVDDGTITSHIKRIRKKFLAVDPAFDASTRSTAWAIAGRHETPALQPAGEARAGPARSCGAAARRRSCTSTRSSAFCFRSRSSRCWPSRARSPRRCTSPQLLASASGRDDEVDAICSACSAPPRAFGWSTAATRSSRRREPAARDRSGFEAPWWQPVVTFSFGWLIPRPTEDFAEGQVEDVLATGWDVAAALRARPRRALVTRDGRAVVISAAHPIWSGDEVAGAVVTEETTNPVMSVKSRARAAAAAHAGRIRGRGFS